MSISKDPYIKIRCDNCQKLEEIMLNGVTHYDSSQITMVLDNAGWTKDGENDICPECYGS